MDSDIRLRLNKAIALFNKGEFYECHDLLEDIWFDIRGSSRDFYQGLIHLAVGLHHLMNKNNIKGAILQLEKGIKKLTPYKPEFEGVSLEKLIKKIKNIQTELKENNKIKSLPKIKFTA